MQRLNGTCNNCQKTGHKKSECRAPGGGAHNPNRPKGGGKGSDGEGGGEGSGDGNGRLRVADALADVGANAMAGNVMLARRCWWWR